MTKTVSYSESIQLPQRRALVVGMGVTGLATAGRLAAAGWEPVLIERSADRRRGGYFICLFEAGRYAAERLGILPFLHDRNPQGRTFLTDRKLRSQRALGLKDLPGSPWMLLRSDVEDAAFEALPDDVEIRYSTVPVSVDADGDGVDVTLRNLANGSERTERFDLVVGADGVRSSVRRLAFGPDEDFLQSFGYMIYAFQYEGQPRGMRTGQSLTLVEPDRALWGFGFSDHDPTMMLSYRTDDPAGERAKMPAERLREVFSDSPLGETLSDVLEAAEHAPSPLWDTVEQVHMPRWHRGRVVLVGDAAWCVTLFAGMGVSAGLIGADVLGSALERHPEDVDQALSHWEETMRPTIENYQQIGVTQQDLFVPRNRRQIALRHVIAWLSRRRYGHLVLDRLLHGEADSRTTDVVLPPAPSSNNGEHMLVA